MPGAIHRLPLSLCPVCGHTLTGAGHFTHPEPPQHRDLTICFRCAARLTFERSAIGQLTVRELTAAEFAALNQAERSELELVEWAVMAAMRKESS